MTHTEGMPSGMDSGPQAAGRTLVTGPPCTLPSPLPVTSFAVGSVAQAADAAARVARARGLRSEFTVDTRGVAAAFASLARLRINGRGPDLFAPLSRFFRTADGWVRLHGNYPHHVAALTRALGTDAPVALSAAMEAMSAQEVEDVVVAAGGLAARVRTAEEWRAHPQGGAVAARPLVDLSLSDMVAPLASATSLPLEGLRVLDLTRVIAGPTATRLLGALGADVLRVDPPHLPELTDQYVDSAFDKRSALADLRTPEHRSQVESLLGAADILVTGYRPGALAVHGLDAQSVTSRHPQLVVVEVSAWGAAGPWTERRGFDSVVQAATGVSDACASPQSAGPGALPVQALDYGVGHLAAAAAMNLLVRRATLGAGTARISLAGAAHWLLSHRPGWLDLPQPRTDTEPDFVGTSGSPYGDLTYVLPALIRDGRSLDYRAAPQVYGGASLTWRGQSQDDSSPGPG